MVLISSSLFFACNQSDKSVDTSLITNPVSGTTGGVVDSSALPKMVFEEYEYDFGRIQEGEKVTYMFKFTNTGKSNLVIATAAGSCGCTVPKFPKEPIKPGESEFIKVEFDSKGRVGPNEKQVTISANTIPNITELKIKAEVIK